MSVRWKNKNEKKNERNKKKVKYKKEIIKIKKKKRSLLERSLSLWGLITGSKSGEYEELRERAYTKILSNGTLLLQHVKEDREGFYLCQASNGIGSGIGKVVQLKVNCKYLAKFFSYKIIFYIIKVRTCDYY